MATFKYYPSAEELTTVTNLLYCTESGCLSVFKSESNLNLHLAKRHKKKEVANILNKQEHNREYYCPNNDCVYNTMKYFKSMKLLKQHFLKVHSRKDILCTNCNKGFPTEASRNNHFEYCGINFKCRECEASYTCYDTLTTHGRRKKHKIHPKAHYKQDCSSTSKVVYVFDNNLQKKEQILLPKARCSSEVIQNTKTVEKSSQTDVAHQKLKSTKTLKDKYSSNSTQKQDEKQLLSCAETQTIGNYYNKDTNCNTSNNSSIENFARKSIKTQTATVTSTTKSCNTSFNLNEFEFSESDIERTTLGTQTLAMLSNLLENSVTSDNDAASSSSHLNFEFISCQTTYNDNLNFDSATFFNCTETQTDLLIDSTFNLLESDFYSNMYTQTSDILSSDMEFNDIHTQTVMDDILRSVGSQTTMSLNPSSVMICRDIAHIETQTDFAFKQMLEEINA